MNQLKQVMLFSKEHIKTVSAYQSADLKKKEVLNENI